jgi:hypothetical protein
MNASAHLLPAVALVLALPGLNAKTAAAIRTVINVDDSGTGSLRDAIAQAAPDDTVRFAVTGTITLTSGEIGITKSLTIEGPHTSPPLVVTRNGMAGSPEFRIFHISGGVCTISGLSIRGGTTHSTYFYDPTPALGGGILVRGPGGLIISDCTLSGHSALGGIGGGAGTGRDSYGGAVAGTGGAILTVNRCTFFSNTAQGAAGMSGIGDSGGHGGRGQGGAIYNDFGGTLTVTNSTFSGNRALGGNAGYSTFGFPPAWGGGAGGGAIANAGTMTLTSLTLAGNQCIGATGAAGTGFARGGGLLALSGASSAVSNTLCAGNTAASAGPDASGSFTSGGFNLVGTGGTGFTGATDQQGTPVSPLDAKLGPLQNNGGLTDTHSPLPGSPVLDRGLAFDLPTDQRAVSRTWDDPALANSAGSDGTDIGALEFRPAYDGPPFFISVSTTGSVLHLIMQGIPGESYQLRTSSALQSWTNVGPAGTAGGFGLIEFIDPAPAGSRGFYRADQLP